MPVRRPRERKFTAQLVIMEEPDVAGRVRAWAEVNHTELAPTLRELVRAGLAVLEPEWIKANGGELAPNFLAAHVRESEKRRRSTAA
jgi:hypothetical protein